MPEIRLSEKVGSGYGKFWNFKGRYLICKGSRGSKKSTTASMKIIYTIMRYPLSNALVVRQVFNTLRSSCYEQLKWAAANLGVSHLWRFTVQPLEATFIPTGQKIYFRGLDNPQSITSITVSVGYLNLVWFEEFYQVIKEDDFNKVDLSIRGQLPEGYYKQIIGTFNPWSDKSWIKKRFFDVPDDENKLALTTNYLCNEWLGDDDRAIFEEMKQKFPRRYKIEGLGEWGVSEGLIYDNWKQDTLPSTIGDLPLWVGVDFGWRDPTAISCCRVDEQQKIIYIFQEYYKSEATIEEIYQWLIDNGYSKSIIFCDSAEPRSIDALSKMGLKVFPAKKGAGSIMEGIRKLQEYDIVVGPDCPNHIIEFSNYAFAKDKLDNWTDKPEDGSFNHLMDALRYAAQCGEKHSIKPLSKSMLGL